MKIKSLLFAGLFASMCLSASAQYAETTSYLSVNGGETVNFNDADGFSGFDAAGEGLNPGDELYVPIYIMNEGSIKPTNIEFALVLPEGLTPADDPIGETMGLTKRVGKKDVALLVPNSAYHTEAWTDQSGNNLPARSLKVVLQNNDGNNPIECGEKADVCYLIATIDDDAKDELEVSVLAPAKFALEGETVQHSTAHATKIKVKSSAVESVKGDKAVAGVKYYNVAGVESNEAFEGVNIKVTKYVDGTTKAVKVVK